MNEQYDDFKPLLTRAVPPVGARRPSRDLWPDVAKRLQAAQGRWVSPLDWVLAAGAAAACAALPAAIPVLLYLL